MSTSEFKVDDLVVLDDAVARAHLRGVVMKVTRILPANLIAVPVNGGRPVKARKEFFRAAPADPSAVATAIPYLPPLDVGQVVTVAGPGWRQPADELYVVLGTRPDGAVKIVRLGGAEGRYWPRVPRAFLTVIDRDRITVAPAA